jgi:hypothetical protein
MCFHVYFSLLTRQHKNIKPIQHVQKLLIYFNMPPKKDINLMTQSPLKKSIAFRGDPTNFRMLLLQIKSGREGKGACLLQA